MVESPTGGHTYKVTNTKGKLGMIASITNVIGWGPYAWIPQEKTKVMGAINANNEKNPRDMQSVEAPGFDLETKCIDDRAAGAQTVQQQRVGLLLWGAQ
jgi:hypothetical protein